MKHVMSMMQAPDAVFSDTALLMYEVLCDRDPVAASRLMTSHDSNIIDIAYEIIDEWAAEYKLPLEARAFMRVPNKMNLYQMISDLVKPL